MTAYPHREPDFYAGLLRKLDDSALLQDDMHYSLSVTELAILACAQQLKRFNDREEANALTITTGETHAPSIQG